MHVVPACNSAATHALPLFPAQVTKRQLMETADNDFLQDSGVVVGNPYLVIDVTLIVAAPRLCPGLHMAPLPPCCTLPVVVIYWGPGDPFAKAVKHQP